MPHFRLEYSSNLEDLVDFGALCETVIETLFQTGLFEKGAIRVRAFASEHYAVADNLPENGFIDMSFRIGTGRSEDEKRHAGELVFGAVERYVAKLFETPHFALSLEITEIDPVLSWRKNTMHSRIRDAS